MITRTISRYRILEKLGAGGMGEVFLAEDIRLARKVALKFLPAELCANEERIRRFMQEARAASALNHPNIITVYDIGEEESGRFIAMEYIEGRTLRALMNQRGSLNSLAAIGRQIAKALAVAHAVGIIHRDIKPENVMVRDDGYVKVLDFGLARLASALSNETSADTAFVTGPGTVIGTNGLYVAGAGSRGTHRCCHRLVLSGDRSLRTRYRKASFPGRIGNRLSTGNWGNNIPDNSTGLGYNPEHGTRTKDASRSHPVLLESR